MTHASKPKYYRKVSKNGIGWEVYSFKSFFITVSIGSCEIQINKWRK